ncbi:hypothetical protein ACGFIF_39170 [Kribbella sp. NPDC049174]|uniref:hypothetical protein n=1 Tax=Kribbella sp. NPDC049174 TaxID=3364112 RepID=UPI0037122B9F
MQWLDENPDVNAGKVRILEDHKTVVVYWKGDPPAGLLDFVTSLPVPVSVRKATYSKAELMAAARVLKRDNPGVVSGAGPNRDYSAVRITLSKKVPAPETMLAALRARGLVPIEFGGVEEVVSLDGRTPSRTCPLTPAGGTAARCGDVSPFYGGGLMHKYGSSEACSIGASVYAPPSYNYVTTAWHCGAGRWDSYDSGRTVGVANTTQYNILHDIRVIPATSTGRIWTGDGYTTSSRAVYAAKYVPEGFRVVCSCGASGNSLIAQYVVLQDWEWDDDYGAAHVGFRVETYTASATGTVQRGDSGSPIIRSNSAGQFEVNGFLSGGVDGYITLWCQNGRHDGFNGPCYDAYSASNATHALASMALYIKIQP